MLAHSIIFYFFSFITIASSLMVISSKNTVHAVFFLILDFVSISSLFIMLGAEFLGMIMLDCLCRSSSSTFSICCHDD